ncbi:hypothetical protein ONZ45_g14374 [Pleurotus djamor]|nr:hypothetical protein ONZ45_g14374 [Pleurotus djamor]
MSYPTRQLGKNGPTVSAIALGAMRMGLLTGEENDARTFETLTHAADIGVTFWDTADVYQRSETLIGEWFTKTGRRSEIFLATKFGGFDLSDPERFLFPNSKPGYIKRQLENSLKALQTDYIDLYYQHRVDPDVPIEVVMETLRKYVESGKIKWIGMSECSAESLKRAKAVPGIGDKVVAAQMEFSAMELFVERSGFASVAEELGVSIVAYSPLCRGMISGKFRSPDDFEEDDARKHFPRFFPENFPKNLAIVDKLKVVADRKGATPGQVALAWILASHPSFIPLPGVTKREQIAENAKAAEIPLTSEEIAEIRSLAEAAEPAGERYPDAFKGNLDVDSLPLAAWKGE